MTDEQGRRSGIGSPGGSWTQVETSVPDGTEVSGVDGAPKSTAVKEGAARLGLPSVDVGVAARWVVVFTNGNATSVLAKSMAEAKRLTNGTPDQFGTPRKVLNIRKVL